MGIPTPTSNTSQHFHPLDIQHATLDTHTNLLHLPSSSLFVRPCYPTLFVLVTTFLNTTLESYDIVLTGSYGVGKRSFLNYVFYRFRSLPSPPTIVMDIPHCFACITSDGTIRFDDTREGFQEELAQRTTIYLCDATTQSPLHVNAKTLVVFPPIRAREDAFKHEQQRITFVMPLWTMDELETCRETSYPHVSSTELHQRYEMWGGLVRRTLVEPLGVATAQFTRSSSLLTLELAAKLVEMRGYVTSDDDATEASYLIAMNVEENNTFRLQDASLCTQVVTALITTAPSGDHVLRFLRTHRAKHALDQMLQQIEKQLMAHMVML